MKSKRKKEKKRKEEKTNLEKNFDRMGKEKEREIKSSRSSSPVRSHHKQKRLLHIPNPNPNPSVSIRPSAYREFLECKPYTDIEHLSFPQDLSAGADLVISFFLFMYLASLPFFLRSSCIPPFFTMSCLLYLAFFHEEDFSLFCLQVSGGSDQNLAQDAALPACAGPCTARMMDGWICMRSGG